MTHGERIGERVKSLYCRWNSLGFANVPLSISTKKLGPQSKWTGDQDYALIISHPHGQPKMITVGQLRDGVDMSDDYLEYHTATCPGSSGAMIARLYRDGHGARLRQRIVWRLWCSTVHSGSQGKPSTVSEQQVNYGNYWFP